jgi:hypothetical protein
MHGYGEGNSPLTMDLSITRMPLLPAAVEVCMHARIAGYMRINVKVLDKACVNAFIAS